MWRAKGQVRALGRPKGFGSASAGSLTSNTFTATDYLLLFARALIDCLTSFQAALLELSVMLDWLSSTGWLLEEANYFYLSQQVQTQCAPTAAKKGINPFTLSSLAGSLEGNNPA